MKVKTIKEATQDLRKLSTGGTCAFYMTWTLLRLEKGDPDYYPTPQEFIDLLGYKSTSGFKCWIENLKMKDLIPQDYEYISMSTFFDSDGNMIKVGDSGIYCIKASNGVYIGLSSDLNGRLRSHDRQIKKGKHRYIGKEENPQYIILERVEDNNLLQDRERYWAKRAIFKGVNVFNEENFT